MTRYTSGLRGEAQAEEYLAAKGMVCLERRYRAADGELDLIMEDSGIVVFVEVKYRPQGRAGEGLQAVTPAKQKRMAHAAMAYLTAMEKLNCPARFDVVEITQAGIIHIPNAFMIQG